MELPLPGLLALPLWVATLITTSIPLHAAELTSRPGAGGPPTEVRIQALLLDLENISGADQNFTVNFGYSARWTDKRLSHDGDGDRTVALDDVWHPRLQIVNRQSLQETFPAEARVSPDGEVTTIQRVWGQLSQPLVLHDFPFDQQTLRVDLAGAGHEPGTVTFADDPNYPSAVKDDLSISDWTLTGWAAEPFKLSLARADQYVPAFRLALSVERNYRYHLVNFIIPLILIICMSWVVFWINPRNANPRISVSVTAMLTLIAYRFAVSASLPKIGYLTRMDWFILGSSVLVFTSLLEVVVTSYLAENDRLETASSINRRMRFIAPVAFVVIVLASLVW